MCESHIAKDRLQKWLDYQLRKAAFHLSYKDWAWAKNLTLNKDGSEK